MDKTTPKWKYKAEIKFKKPGRKIYTLFLHCSASDSASHDDISVIKRWHTVDNNWPHVGYHFFINKNGDIQEGCSLESTPIAQKGYNTGSIAICLHGLKKNKFTEEQFSSVRTLCASILEPYSKKIRIRGHSEVSKKSCPVFDYKTVLNLNSNGYRSESAIKPTSNKNSQTTEADDQTIAVLKSPTAIRIFNKGNQVKTLQQLLTQLGHPCFCDGLFGKKTEQVVRGFQRAKRITADGIVGIRTIDAMFSSKSVLLKMGDKRTDVKVLQLLLTMIGKLIIHDGIFGSGTEKALKSQQKLLRLKADGIFGAKTREKLLNAF